jgi:hypothetical protein
MLICHPLILSHEAVHAVMNSQAELCIKIPENIYQDDFTVKLGETFWLADHFPAKVGEYIWVREDHKIVEHIKTVSIIYRDGMVLRRFRVNFEEPSFGEAWRSPVAMPRAAARCVFQVRSIDIYRGVEEQLFWLVNYLPVYHVIEFLDKVDAQEWGTNEN